MATGQRCDSSGWSGITMRYVCSNLLSGTPTSIEAILWHVYTGYHTFSGLVNMGLNKTM